MSIADKLTTVADNMSKVYEAGQKSEYDKFWDNFQDYGNRTNYEKTFQGISGFNNQNFYPKYDIRPVGSKATYLFYGWTSITNESLKTINLKERLEECGVVLDLSQATDVSYAFAYFYSRDLPTIDLTGLTTNSTLLFGDNHSNLKSIEKLILAETTPFNSNWFRSDTGLENLIVEGTIGQNNFSVKDCTKLSKASILSILKALSLNITETKTITFSTKHQATIETDEDCKPYWQAAKDAGWSFVYA